jgi:tetratricopeptide (TPR) repeat protein
VLKLSQEKKRIEALIKSRQFDEALERCNALLADGGISSADVLRLRAFAYASAGQYDAAIVDRQSIVEGGTALLRDYFQLGDNAIAAGRFAEAAKWLTKTLHMGREQKERWFEAAAYMLLAHAQVHTGAIGEARENLERAIKIDPECMMPLVGGEWATYQSINEQIDRHSRGSSKPRQ